MAAQLLHWGGRFRLASASSVQIGLPGKHPAAVISAVQPRSVPHQRADAVFVAPLGHNQCGGSQQRQ